MSAKQQAYEKFVELLESLQANENLTTNEVLRLSVISTTIANLVESLDTDDTPLQLYYDIEKKLSEKGLDVDTKLQAVQALLDSVTSNEALTYTVDKLDDEFSNIANATFPNFGYVDYKSKKENFVFLKNIKSLASFVDKNRYLRFPNKIVDTYGDKVADLSTSTIHLAAGASLTIDGTYNYTSSSSSNGLCTIMLDTSIADGETVLIEVDTEDAINTYLDFRWNGIYDSNNIEYLDNVKGKTYFVHTNTTGANQAHVTLCGTGANSFVKFSSLTIHKISLGKLLDFIPEVIVQDQATSGLILQENVRKGDYVVKDRKVLSSKSNVFATNSASTDINIEDDSSSSFSVGQEVVILNASDEVIANGKITLISDSATVGEDYIRIDKTYNRVNGETYKIKDKEEVLRATKDIVDMYDTEIESNVSVTISTNEVYLMTGFNTNNGFYQRIGGSGTTTYPSTTDFQADFNSWKYLGTASNMSLENPFFENADNRPISNPIAALHKYNPILDNYDGIVGEILLHDPLAIETQKGIMQRNGFYELAKGAYGKAYDIHQYIFIGYWNTLCKTAYHPIFNNDGTARYVKNTLNGEKVTWDSSNTLGINSIANACDIGTVYDGSKKAYDDGSITVAGSGRPDDKSFDIIYKDQFVDMREYAFIPDNLTLAKMKKDKELEGIRGGVVAKPIDSSNGFTYYAYTSTKTAVYAPTNGEFDSLYDIGDAVQLLYVNGADIQVLSGIVESKIVDAVVVEHPHFPSTLTLTQNISDGVFYSMFESNHNTQETHLRIDALGNNFPQSLKDRLAEGKHIHGLYFLGVDDKGNSLMPDGASKDYKFSAKNIKSFSTVYSIDGGGSWTNSLSSWDLDNVNNKKTRSLNASVLLFEYYEAENHPMIKADPLQIIFDGVTPKVFASNHHKKGSIYANMINIQTGKHDNGFISRTLENIELHEAKYKLSELYNKTTTMYDGDTIYVDVINNLEKKETLGRTLEWVFGTYSANTSYFEGGFNPALGALVKDISIKPNHQDLDLFPQDAVKWYETLATDEDGYLYHQIFMKKLIWNFNRDNGEEFTNISEDSTATKYKGDIFHVTNGIRTGYWKCLLGPTTLAFKSIELQEVDNKLIWKDGTEYFERWDGTGFGDNKRFDHSSNGTTLDFHNTRVKTVVARRNLGVRI